MNERDGGFTSSAMQIRPFYRAGINPPFLSKT